MLSAATVLHKLLSRAERARLRGGAKRAIGIAFTRKSLAGYYAFENLDAKERFHADLREAEADGAIRIQWDPRAGERRHIQKVLLVDESVLAAHLEVTPYWDQLQAAKSALAPWLASSRTADVLEAWSNNRKVRGLTPNNAPTVVKACQVLDYIRNADLSLAQGIPARRVGAELFGDSKAIEALVPVLDELTREPEDPIDSQPISVLQRLGLVKHPQPLLLAGGGRVQLSDTASPMAIVRPYLGIAPDALLEYESPTSGLSGVLTVENLTTFNELARSSDLVRDGLVLFTGGTPSPAFRRVYRELSKQIGMSVPFWHWGDIDPGGFRIALILARDIPDRLLRPWLMSPAEIPEAVQVRKAGKESRDEMVRAAQVLGWVDTAAALEHDPIKLEQEILPPRLPWAEAEAIV